MSTIVQVLCYLPGILNEKTIQCLNQSSFHSSQLNGISAGRKSIRKYWLVTVRAHCKTIVWWNHGSLHRGGAPGCCLWRSVLGSPGRPCRVDMRNTEPQVQSYKRVSCIGGSTLFLLWLGLNLPARGWRMAETGVDHLSCCIFEILSCGYYRDSGMV